MRQPLRRVLVLALGIAILAPIVVVGLYGWTFAAGSGHALSHNSEEWARFGEYVGGSLGALYALLAFGGVLMTIREQQAQARRDVRSARTAARTAREGLDIARRTMVDSGRAYVEHSGVRWISHRREGTGEVFWRIRPAWTNVGSTPTRKLRVRVHYEITDFPHDPDFASFTVDYPKELGQVTLAPKQRIESSFFEVNGADLLLVKDGKKHLYAWGAAEYNDVFPGTPRRLTKFCLVAGDVTGDPTKEWNEKKNPVEIRWGHVGPRNNFMDDDCVADCL